MTAYIKSKTFSKTNNSRGLAVLSILIVFSIFCLGFLYIFQTNSLVGCSYQIREQKEHLEKLQVKNKDLEMEIASWQSPVNLEEIVKSLNMVEVGQIVYLKGEKAVAVKE